MARDPYLICGVGSRDLRLPSFSTDDAESAYRGPVVLYYPQSMPQGPDRDLYLAVAQVSQKTNLNQGIQDLSACRSQAVLTALPVHRGPLSLHDAPVQDRPRPAGIEDGPERSAEASGRGAGLALGLVRAPLGAAEAALSFLLLARALVMVRSFVRLMVADPGFRAERLLRPRRVASRSKYPRASTYE